MQKILAFVLIVVSLSVFGTPSKPELVRNLDFIANVFRNSYAPADWKKQFANWDIETVLQQAKDKITDQTTLRQYQVILKQFLNSTQDYHVSIQFHSTETASLPFSVKGAGDRYYLAYIDRTLLGPELFPFSPGDELVTFGDRPVQEVIADLKSEISANVEGTDRALAEIYLTNRSRARAMEVPNGTIRVGVRPKGTEDVKVRQLIWTYQPETISAPVNNSSRNKILSLQMVSDRAVELTQTENPFGLGGRKSYLPDLGTKIWETAATNPFYAYIYRSLAGKLVGVVRIPSYVAGAKEASEFEAILKHFQANTDSLVIDQINNPGGSVFYLYTLVSMLTDRPFNTPWHRMTLNQAVVREYHDLLDLLKDAKSEEDAKVLLDGMLGGYPGSYQVVEFLRSFSKFMIQEWNAGRRLTNPYYLYVDQINPHPRVQYTKPVLLLVNELDFSGGDFFPAILQDNKRVKIFGARTAGAGGYVERVQYPNIVGVNAFSFTGSLAQRVDLHPIENLGVKPDIEYQLTKEDLEGSFQSYVRAIQAAVEE